jgi:tRNA dimethylallyltransferase
MRIMIAGPTASGKTALSIELAQKIDGEIISVDSRQCYRLLDIGTAKPTREELELVPHHNISILDPDISDSAALFHDREIKYREEIAGRGKRVIYCGGSTLHLQSLIRPLDEIPSSDQSNIDELNRQANRDGLQILYDKLKKVDPHYAQKMDGLNRQRIIRALDVWKQTGKPFSSYHSDPPFEKPDDLMVFILHHPRKILHQRISDRTENMFKLDFLGEVRNILNKGYSPQLQSLQTVGYREAILHLQGKINADQMVKDIKTATRRYAKRQITWFRRWPFVHQLQADGKSVEELAYELLLKVAADTQNR